MIEFIDWKYFIFSLALGLLYIYIVEPPMKSIYVFPTPDNVDKIQYVDHTDTCFDFQAHEVACGDDVEIENYTVQ